MRFEDLSAAVRAGRAADGGFALLLSGLGSSRLTDLAARFLPGGQLRLAGAAGVEASAGTVTVRGSGVETPFAGTTMVAEFFLVAGEPALRVVATASVTWSFPQAFPALGQTMMASLRLSPAPAPVLRLASHAEEGRPAGMSFAGALDLAATTGGLSTLLGVSTQPLSGTLKAARYGAEVVGIGLESPAAASVDLGIATVEGLSFGVGADFVHDRIGRRRLVAPWMWMSGTIAFQAGGSTYPLPLTAEVWDLGRHWRFETGLTGVIGAAWHEIGALAGGVQIGGLLPSGLHLDDLLHFERLTFDLDAAAPASQKVSFAALEVRNGSPWQVLRLGASDQELTIDQLRLTVGVFQPFGSRTVQVTLQGEVAVGEAGVLVVSTRFPGFVLSAALKEGSTLRLDEAIRYFAGTGIDVPRIEVTELQLQLDGGDYRLEVEVLGEWQIGSLPLAVERVYLMVEHRAGDTSVEAAGRLRLAGVDLFLSASHGGSGRGWRFEGGTTPGQTIPIGEVIQELANTFGVGATVPASIASAVIDRLHVSFDTATRAFTFSCETQLTLDAGKVLDLVVDVNVEPSGTGYRKTFRGRALVGGREFDLVFDADPAATRFLAAYENLSGGSADLGTLLSGIVAAPGLSALSIDLKDALLAYDDTAGGTAGVLFGADIGAGVDLANLPLVGRAFPSGSSLTLAFQPLVASAAFSEAMLNGLRPLVPSGGLALPKGPLDPGLTLATRLQVGSQPIDLSLPLKLDSGGQIQHTAGATAPPPAGSTPAPSDGTHWIKLQKSFGPLHLQRIGARYDNGDLWFLLDGGLAAGGLTLELDGLGVAVALSDIQSHTFHPKFALRGISIDYTNGPVEVGGSLLHLPPATPADPDEYDGSAVIRTSALNLFVLGSYAELNGSRSLFLYGALNYPIGGPPFCFVTGLAAGFGFNRTVRRPTLDQVATFPLVAEAMSGGAATPPAAGADARSYLETKLRALHEYLPVQTGSMFFAVGIHFTTFKLVDSFALATVKVGPHVEVDVLGLSTGYLPPSRDGQPVTPVAELQLALEASFRPDEGLLAVSAQLTRESYLLSRDCHLTGGFAFYCWFTGEHAGDFVLTVGGYHPSFTVPAHYPTVPRLGFNWQVTGDLSLKGGMYFALTAHALMAGGELEAVWESGSLRAWFRAEANFLVAWQPYHYEAGISVNMGVSYTYWFFGTHHISVDVGADLNVWGPDFSGTASVHLWIVSFTISFGADASPPPALSWDEFRKAFLPAHEGHVAVGVTATRGLSRRMPLDGGGELWIVDPKTLVISITTPVPVTAATAGGQPVPGPYAPVGIAPMDKRSHDVASTLEIGTTHRVALADTRVADTASFHCAPVHGKSPAALWGNSRNPDLNAHSWVNGTVAEIDVSPATPPRAAATHNLRRSDLAYKPDLVSGAPPVRPTHRFTPGAEFDRAEFDRAAFVGSIASDATVAARAAFLRSLGLDPALVSGLERTTADDFLFAPRVGSMTLAT